MFRGKEREGLLVALQQAVAELEAQDPSAARLIVELAKKMARSRLLQNTQERT